MKKRILLAVIVVILIGLGIFFAFKLNDIENNNENNIETNNAVVENNVINNTVNNNEINNVVNNTVTNTNTEEISSSDILNEEAKEQKAMNIAKDNWGEDDTVYFYHDKEQDLNGKIIIEVRDKSTTKELYTYTVDIETGTFTIE